MCRGRCSCGALKLLRRRVVAPATARRVAGCARRIGRAFAAASSTATLTATAALTTAAATVSLAHCYALSVSCARRSALTRRQPEGHCANLSNETRDGMGRCPHSGVDRTQSRRAVVARRVRPLPGRGVWRVLVRGGARGPRLPPATSCQPVGLGTGTHPPAAYAARL